MDTQQDPTDRAGVNPDRLVTPDELAQLWSCSRATVYRQLDQGLPSLKLGRSRRIRLTDAARWLAHQVEMAS
jgi:excisionase family DNA binding protein